MVRMICLLVLLSLIFVLDISGAAVCKETTDSTVTFFSKKPACTNKPINEKIIKAGSKDTKSEKIRQLLGQDITKNPTLDEQGAANAQAANKSEATKAPADKLIAAKAQGAANMQEKAEAPAEKAVTVLSQEEMSGIYKGKDEKVVYLTFDDGPSSSCTPLILDILAEENIKATFFFIGSQAKRHPGIVRRQYAEGHGIGNHSYTHAFKKIYSDTDYFIEELYKTEKLLQSVLATDKMFRLVRFPGGSYGERLAPFRNRANEEGFIYIDWNCQTGDAERNGPRTPEKLVERFVKTAKGKMSLVVLMHDSSGKKYTVDALPEIIRYLKAEGYRFEILPGSRGI